MAKTWTCGKIFGVSSSFLIGIKKMESQKIVKTFSWNRPISTHADPKNCRWGDFLVENAPDDYVGPAKYRKRCKNLHRNFQIHVKSKFHYLQLSKHIIGSSTEYLNFECAKNNDVHTCASFRIEIIVYIIYDPDRLCLLWKIATCYLLLVI